jgi:glycosyltransferase involved in cell wall biosynthesis
MTAGRRSTTVAVDANPAVRDVQTGTEAYAREVSRRLPDVAPDLRFIFYVSRPSEIAGVDLTVLPGRRLWSQLRLPVELWNRRPDVFFAPSHVVPFLAPGRTVTAIHDLAFERHPGAYRPRDLAYLRLTTRWAARRCRLLLTVSWSTALDLVELYGVDPDRLRVVPLGGGEPLRGGMDSGQAGRRLAALGVDGPFALHVGRVEPRKNQLTALAAVERLDSLLLVCAGPVVDEEVATRLRRSRRCRVLGRVSDSDLESLYAQAEVLLFPSLYEGFGLPVLEAMRRGVPVVTVAVSSLPEVGGSAAIFVEDPLDAEGLAIAVEEAIAQRPELAGLGRAQAARFTWHRTAEAVAQALREAAS